MIAVDHHGPVHASVVIPTRNREATIRRAIDAMVASGLPAGLIEVVVVHNGGPVPLDLHRSESWPVLLKTLHLVPPSAALARNHGAQESAGDILVFMDDDVVLGPGAFIRLLRAAEVHARAVVMGNLVTCVPSPESPFSARLVAREREAQYVESRSAVAGIVSVSNGLCMTGLIAMRRDVFYSIGMFEDPANGSHFWDDVEFGNRATRCGYAVLRQVDAVAEHWDLSASSLELHCARWQRASWAAASVFARHPELRAVIPMYRDMGPADWRREPLTLTLRKHLRRLSATSVGMTALHVCTRFAERGGPIPRVVDPLHRWLVGAYVCRGYRDGLRVVASASMTERAR